MGYEVDFIGVGEESQCGDAIAIRFGNLYGSRSEQTVVVIDGGFKDDGQRIVDHIKTHYSTEVVDLVINTHPDQDHINGLEAVISELDVKELWLHLPWEHNQGLAEKFHDGRITDNSISEKLKETLNKAHELYELAISKGITVKEPFADLSDAKGNVKILGPTLDYYESLIPEFDGMPETKSVSAMFESAFSRVLDGIKKIFARWGEDHINDDSKTSAKNNSSAITQIIVDGRRLIFTGDAGIEALDYAADQLNACIDPANIRFFQIPHHGSRRNVGPSVLNRLIGEPVPQGQTRLITAIASSSKKGEPKHPRKAVLNAFTHRGASVLATRGDGIRHHYNAPNRHGWGSLESEPYHWEYEEEA
jgi:beta-lactamase superfamily II metal-dependent hydrolase